MNNTHTLALYRIVSSYMTDKCPSVKTFHRHYNSRPFNQSNIDFITAWMEKYGYSTEAIDECCREIAKLEGLAIEFDLPVEQVIKYQLEGLHKVIHKIHCPMQFKEGRALARLVAANQIYLREVGNEAKENR